MSVDWQTIAAWLCVAGAGLAVAARAWGWLVGSRQTACGAGCRQCAARRDKPLVEIHSIQSLIGQPTKK